MIFMEDIVMIKASDFGFFPGNTPEKNSAALQMAADIGGEIFVDGKGIADVKRAVEPFFTTLEGDERSGMGFTIMQTFMSEFSLQSEEGKGTTVRMTKEIGA